MKNLKVILRQDIDKLGDAGEIVTVKPGFARNYLLPRGYAFEARVSVRLRTAGGQLLAHTTTLVHRPDVAMAGPLSCCHCSRWCP